MNEEFKPLFQLKKLFLWLALILIFGVGLVIRVYDYDDPLLDFHPTRQLHSALMARGMYYENLTTVPEWQRDMAVRQWKAEGVIELPFVEWLAAQTYKLAGGAYLWIPRLYSILFWMLGGVAMFLLARELAGMDGALVAALYFLILPYGAIASRSFQPDPLMTALIVFAYWGMVRWQRTPTWKWVLVAGVFSGLAILCKAVAAFFIAPAWLGLILTTMDLKKAFKDPQVWALGLLTVVPYGIYHIYGYYIAGYLQSQYSLRFFPQLWKDPVFYLRWNGEISSVVGFEWFLMSILGLLAIRKKQHRVMFLAALAGYFVYGLTLSYHISTHDYYQLPLIPIVAVGLAAGAAALFEKLASHEPRWLSLILVTGVLVYALTIKAWDVRVTLKKNDYRNEAAFWEEISQKIGGASVIGLTQDYGYRLAYWGWASSENWMTSGDFNYRVLAGQEFDMDSLFKETTEGKDYFVVTIMDELDRQPALKSLLEKNCAVFDKGGGYIIYDLKNPPAAKPAASVKQ